MTHVSSEISNKIQYIDLYIGMRIRERRVRLGMSQAELADAIGVTYQQVRKYEHGINRVSASRLYLIATVLQVSMDYFLEGYEACGRQIAPTSHSRMTLELSENFSKIKDERHKQIVADLARALATP